MGAWLVAELPPLRFGGAKGLGGKRRQLRFA